MYYGHLLWKRKDTTYTEMKTLDEVNSPGEQRHSKLPAGSSRKQWTEEPFPQSRTRY